MKKIVSLFLSIAMLLSITAGLDLSAYSDISSDNENVTLSDETLEIYTDEVVSISYTVLKPYEITENINGYWDEYYYVDEDGKEQCKNYWHYNNPTYQQGDILTVVYKSGKCVDYVLNSYAQFISENGQIIYAWDLNLSTNQNLQPWTIGGDNYFSIEYMGAVVQVPVAIVENPVASIFFIPIKPYEFIENTHGYWEEQNGEKYYSYNIPDFVDGDMITVTYKTGNSVDYIHSKKNEHSFVSENGDVLYNIGRSYNQRWAIGEENYFSLEYMGTSTLVPVTIVESPVTSINYESVDGFVNSERTTYIPGDGDIENVSNGYIRNDDKLTVNYKEEGIKEYFAVRDNAGHYEFLTADGEKLDESADFNLFVNDGGLYVDNSNVPTSITVNCYGKTVKLPITNKITVEKIEFISVSPVTIIESDGNETGRNTIVDSDGNVKYYCFDTIYENNNVLVNSEFFKIGDVINVTYSNGATKKFTYYANCVHSHGFYGLIGDDGTVFYLCDGDINDNQNEHFWTVDSENNYFTINISNVSSDKIPVTIVAKEVHTHSYSISEVIEGNCVTPGYIVYRCECGDTYREEMISTGHRREILKGKEPTCTETGLTDGYYCPICETILEPQEVIPVKEHQYKTETILPTSNSQGYIKHTCVNCGDTYNSDYFYTEVFSDITSAAAGSTIRVPVSINNNTGILGWKLTFDYDTDVLIPISVDYGEVISGGIQDNIEGDMAPGSINVYWAGSDNEDYNGVMFYINFEVNPSAVGNTKIDITYSPEDTFDTDFNDVYLDCQPINLSIINNAYSQYSKINASADDVTAGDDLQLKLNISEINSVTKTNVTVDYNADNFEFKSISSANGITVKNTDNNGKLALDISGITSAVNDADFVTVTFKCKDKAMSGNYDFAVSSADEGIICKGCTVKVNPSATSEIAEVFADDVMAKYNDEITIPIYIENNHGVMGYRLDFTYDTNLLQPLSTSCGTDFSNGGQFNDSIGVKDGEFKVLWNNVDEKFANGILLNLKFKVLTDEKVDTAITMTYSQPDTFNEKYEDVVFNCKDINVSLNNHQHSYTAVVTEPTCTEKGYTTYICSCGDSYIEDETAALGHSYGQWNYNGDAEYVSSTNYKNGTQTRTCSVCGEEETVEAPNTALLRRRGNALALESSITLTTYITKDVVDYYDEVYAEFTRNGKTEKVYASDKTFKSGSTVYNIFDYAGISPQAMGDDIEIKFYGIKDGVKYWGETYTYSVTTYVTSTLSKSTTSDKLKTMLVDLMYYGEACQIYQNYKTDSLMTNILTDEQKQLRSKDELNLTNIKESSYATCENRLVRFGTALRLNNAVEVAIPLNMTNVTLEELTFKVKIGSRDLTYTYSDNPENFEKGKDGYWYFYFDGVYANQMSDEVFITAYRGDEQVSYTLKYSVESYAATVTDSKLKKVTDAMMRYGNSAKAYSGK